MKIKIHVTKEVLFQTRLCPSNSAFTKFNCAISFAVRAMFPRAAVGGKFIEPLGHPIEPFGENRSHDSIDLPIEAQAFILDFDCFNEYNRTSMKPISFEIEVPDSVIERIGINQVNEILINSPNLERV